MADEAQGQKKHQLAQALANGTSVAAWIRENGVPRRTAYRWARDPKVRRGVDEIRRRAIDRAVGQMAKRATWAVVGIAKLAEGSESDSVRLQAYRSLLADMISVSKFSVLEGRMNEVEQRLDEKDQAKAIGSG